MPVARHTLPDHNLLITVVSGSLTDAELSRAIRELADDPPVSPGFRELVDCRSLDVTPDLTHLGVVNGAHLERTLGLTRGSHMVIVAPPDVVFGLARAYTSPVDSHRASVQVVRSLSAAISWLDAEGIRPEILGVVPPDTT